MHRAIAVSAAAHGADMLARNLVKSDGDIIVRYLRGEDRGQCVAIANTSKNSHWGWMKGNPREKATGSR